MTALTGWVFSSFKQRLEGKLREKLAVKLHRRILRGRKSASEPLKNELRAVGLLRADLANRFKKFKII